MSLGEEGDIGRGMAKVAHDMRNSLHVISGNSSLIGMLSKEEQIKKIADRISDHAQYLSGVVDDLMLVVGRNPVEVRLKGGALIGGTGEDDSVSSESILQIIREIVEQRAKDFEVSFRSTLLGENREFEPLYAHRTTRIMVNLINNAVDAAPEGEVELVFDCSGENMHIQITDTGGGMDYIPEAQADFAEKLQSQGLGISIVCQLVNLMSGKVEWKSQPKSVVDVHLPYQLI